MHIDPSQASASQFSPLQESQRFSMVDHRRTRQSSQCAEDFIAVRKISASQFANDKGMCPDLHGLQRTGEHFVALAQVIDPNRGVDQDQGRPAALLRRLGMFRKPF